MLLAQRNSFFSLPGFFLYEGERKSNFQELVKPTSIISGSLGYKRMHIQTNNGIALQFSASGLMDGTQKWHVSY